MKCPKCQTDTKALYVHPDGEMCFPCAAAANLEKLKKQLGEFFLSLPAQPLQDLAKAETIKAYSSVSPLFMQEKNKTQMEIFNELEPHYEEQFLTEVKGAVEVDYKEVSCKNMPMRVMGVGFRDRGKSKIKTHATFGCS